MRGTGDALKMDRRWRKYDKWREHGVLGMVRGKIAEFERGL